MPSLQPIALIEARRNALNWYKVPATEVSKGVLRPDPDGELWLWLPSIEFAVRFLGEYGFIPELKP